MDGADSRKTRGFQKFAIFAGVLIIAYGLALAAFSRTGFPQALKTGSPFPYLSDKPVAEDAYYMLTVARNIARGKGIVYNGDKKTTGTQPLATFIYAGLIWVAEKAGGNEWAIIRLVLIFGIVLHLLLAHSIGLISRRLAGAGDNPSAQIRAYALGFVFTLLNFTLFRISTYGLETSLYLLLLSFLVLKMFGISDDPRFPWRQAVILGGLFGLTALARIDFLVIAAVFLAVAFIRRRVDLWRAALIGGMTLLFISPWFYWIKLTSGSWLPSSGQAQSVFLSSRKLLTRLWGMGIALANHLTPWGYETIRKWLVFLGAASFVVAVVWLWRKNREEMNARLFNSLKKYPFCLAWAASLTVLVLVYAAFFWSTHFYVRYSSPVLVLYLPVLANLVQQRLEKSGRWIELGLLAGMLVTFAAPAFLTLHSGGVHSLAINPGFIRDNFSGSARIGAFQSGVLGFFQENVSNLDGKVDGAALRHLRAGTMDRHLDEERIDVLIDWPNYIYPNIDRQYLEDEWEAFPKEVPGGESICLVRKKNR